MASPSLVKMMHANVEKLRLAFQLFDADGSGTIDSDELAHAMRKMGHPVHSAAAMMAEADTDGDGKIDFEGDSPGPPNLLRRSRLRSAPQHTHPPTHVPLRLELTPEMVGFLQSSGGSTRPSKTLAAGLLRSIGRRCVHRPGAPVPAC